MTNGVCRKVGRMTEAGPWGDDRFVWRIPLSGTAFGPMDGPGVDPPVTWRCALDAVARDLRCLRYGRELDVDGLIWELAVDGDFRVWAGWRGGRGVSGFSNGSNLTVDAAYGEAAAWIAEVVQDDLAGYEFVQWPSRGRHLLTPGVRAGEPFWVDPHGDVAVAPIGELCKHAGRRPGAEAST